tara:strand:- start:12526 stop:14109 length:1584 start_codon:yes stop_codon:yes gene_type:complete
MTTQQTNMMTTKTINGAFYFNGDKSTVLYNINNTKCLATYSDGLKYTPQNQIQGFNGYYKKCIVETFVPIAKFCLFDINEAIDNLRPAYLRNRCPHNIAEIKSVQLSTYVAPVVPAARPAPYDFIYRPKKDDGHGYKLPMCLINKIMKMRPCFNKQLQKECDKFNKFKIGFAAKYPDARQDFAFITWRKWRKADKADKKKEVADVLKKIKTMTGKYAAFEWKHTWANVKYNKYRDAPKEQLKEHMSHEANRIAWYYEEHRQLLARGHITTSTSMPQPLLIGGVPPFVEKSVEEISRELDAARHRELKTIKWFFSVKNSRVRACLLTTRKAVEDSWIKTHIRSHLAQGLAYSCGTRYRDIIKVFVAGFKRLAVCRVFHMNENSLKSLRDSCGLTTSVNDRKLLINIIQTFIKDQMNKYRSGYNNMFFGGNTTEGEKLLKIGDHTIYSSPRAGTYGYLHLCSAELELPFHALNDGVRFVEMLEINDGYTQDGYSPKWIDGGGAFRPDCFLANKDNYVGLDKCFDKSNYN